LGLHSLHIEFDSIYDAHEQHVHAGAIMPALADFLIPARAGITPAVGNFLSLRGAILTQKREESYALSSLTITGSAGT